MKARDIVSKILNGKTLSPTQAQATCFAPTNIALCKYWGKRDTELHLPVTSSLSVTLPNKGSTTEIAPNNLDHDVVFLNDEKLDSNTTFAKRLVNFLDLFRGNQKIFFDIHTSSNIPIAAGLASSASGYAALVKALNELCDWQLCDRHLSILARLGSGSAARSFWNGFVQWHAGSNEDGMDSFAEPIDIHWPGLNIGLLIVNKEEKQISSREAMKLTRTTSPLFQTWPDIVAKDLMTIKKAIHEKNFELLGQTVECNALAMHATMLSAVPTINYSNDATLAMREKVEKLRDQGIPVYFTQDAGPNLKLIFLAEHEAHIRDVFPEIEVVKLF